MEKWRVICPACSAWTRAETFEDAERQFELHLAVVHPNLSTSVKPVRIKPLPENPMRDEARSRGLTSL